MICKGVELDVVRGCVKCQEQQVDLSKKWIENPALPVFASGGGSHPVISTVPKELGRLKRNYYYENNIMQESEKRVLQEYDYHYRNQ